MSRFTTKAALFHSTDQPLQVVQVEMEEPGPEDVLVRMSAIGVCGSDLHITRGEWKRNTPMILGHEGSGVVEKVGSDVTHVKVGDRVVLSWAPSCGACPACLRGRPATCHDLRDGIANGTLADGTTRIWWEGEPVYRMTAVGALAERLVMPAAAVIPIGAEISDAEAALIGCAATTGIGAVQNQARVEPGSRALVIGAGGVGQFVIQALRIAEATEIVAIDPTPQRREQALKAGATAAYSPEELATSDADFDYAFEAVGAPQTFESAVASVRTGGMVVMVGMTPAGTGLSLEPADLTVREKVITGSLYGSGDPRETVRDIIGYIGDGRVDVAGSIGEVFTLDEVGQAFAAAERGDGGRMLVTP